MLRNLSDSEITSLIKNNVILLDGESIQVLLERKLGNLIGVEKGEWHTCKTGYQSFEEAQGITVDGVDNPRVTMLQHTGNYLQLTYVKNADVKIWSDAFNSIDQKLGPMMSIVDNHILLMPMSHDVKHGWESQYSTYKQGIMQQMVSSMEKCDYLVDMPNVKLNIDRKQKTMWISNFDLDSYEEIKWHFAEKPADGAVVVRRENDHVTKNKVTIETNNKVATIRTKLGSLETIQLLF